MRAYTKYYIELNPTTEHIIAERYDADPGWKKICVTTAAYIYELVSPIVQCDALYIPSYKGDNNATQNN